MVASETFTFYAWGLSWYSAKVRSYFQQKGIPFTEVKPSAYTLFHTIKKKFHDAVVPVVVSPEGDWIQDSSVILEELEKRFPVSSIYPNTPVQKFFSLLVEIWADEFWHPPALHYRFSFPEENFPKWREEIGTLLAGFPPFIRNIAVKHFYTFMRNATEITGTSPDKVELIEKWASEQLDMLDKHFEQYPYLLGNRATIGDFSLMGPIFGHLVWDERTYKIVVEPRKNLDAWIKRMSSRDSGNGDLLANDAIPTTLSLIEHSIAKELVPALIHLVSQLPNLSTLSDKDTRLDRFGTPVDVPYSDGTLSRIVLTYTLWMLQRLLDTFRVMTEVEKEAVRQWLKDIGAEELLNIAFPRVRRLGLHIAPEIRVSHNS